MTSHDCDHIKGLIALSALDRLAEPESIALLAHLDGCRECRSDERDLRALAAVLPAADPDRLEGEDMPLGLSRAVIDRLRAEPGRRRRTRRWRYMVGAAAAAVVALSLWFSLGGAGPQSETLALSGAAGTHASVQLTAQSWGTSLHIVESGQPGRLLQWVSMQTTSGKWWQAGTYRSVSGHTVQVSMACALELSQIESIWIRDSAGHVILHGYVGNFRD